MQSESLNFLRFRDLTIPYEFDGISCRIGFVGPYSCAFNSFEKPNQVKYIESAFIELTEKVKPASTLIRVPVKRHFVKEFNANISALDNIGFKLNYIDVNSSILLNNNFREAYNRNRMRDLRKKSFHDFEVYDDEFDIAYKLIALNRKQKGIPISMTLDALKRNMISFPERFHTKLCATNGIPSAAAILINVNSRIQYVFMWGHDRSVDNSGLALFRLADEILNSALRSGFQILCLGTSSVYGEVDLGLLQFKNSLGAQTDLRYTLKHSHLP